MAHKTPIANWLYKNRDQFQAQFKELNWPSSYGITIFDFVTTIKFNDQIIEGRGVDAYREVALEKSVSEAIERYICLSMDFSSVGFSVSGVIDTEIHALNELYERYYLDQHIKNKIPLFNLESRFKKDGSIPNFEDKNNLIVDHYIMNTPDAKFGLVCRISSIDRSKIAFGFSLSQNIESAIDKSFFEALPNYAWLNATPNNNEQTIPWQISSDFVEELNSLLFDQKYKIDFNFPEPKIVPVDVNWKSLAKLTGLEINVSKFSLDNSEVLK